uniref:NAD(P)H dehydrogenase subunit CRR3, chloroplastic n=1 Tax=Ananas comosus var. bracteatus TaxID=296719 RepID=A0A6V7NXX1_ANACO|nr:unnamed protein product [Ananas comosus var. bracteatus]
MHCVRSPWYFVFGKQAGITPTYPHPSSPSTPTNRGLKEFPQLLAAARNGFCSSSRSNGSSFSAPHPSQPHSKPTTITSSSHSLRPPPPPPLNLPKKQKQKQQQKQKPSIAEIERAIGVGTDPTSSSSLSSSSSSPSSPFMEFLASTPIGQAESPAERKLREAAEWLVDRTEAHASNGQRILMMVCLKILPVWILLLLVASGVVRLPFHIPFVDDLLS